MNAIETCLKYIRDLGLAPHPEGGFFVVTYVSDILIPSPVASPADGDDNIRPLASVIYYLLCPASLTAERVKAKLGATWTIPPNHRSDSGYFHTNASTTNHTWHGGRAKYTLIRIPASHKLGTGSNAAELAPKGAPVSTTATDNGAGSVDVREINVGASTDDPMQLIVGKGWWKRSELVDENGYCLISETVMPGWHPNDHAFLSRSDLAELFPGYDSDAGYTIMLTKQNLWITSGQQIVAEERLAGIVTDPGGD